MDTLYRNENWLEDKYVNQKLSSIKIAEICNTSDMVIYNWLNKFNIPVRSHSESNYLRYNINIDKDWLKEKYINQKMNTLQIAKICDVSQPTIWNRLKKFHIPIRSQGESHHLKNGNHCNLTNESRQLIDGELLGDGCLFSRNAYSANFKYGSKYEEYINYISNALKSFGIKQVGHIHKVIHPKMNNCIVYHYNSCCYPELLPIRKHWYPNGKKIVPKDIKLTPLVCRQWYIGDGCLHKRYYRKGNPYIIFATCGFPIENVEFLANKLNKLGFKTTRQLSNNTIGISSHSVKDFLNYIGPSPVECYSYKWNYENVH